MHVFIIAVADLPDSHRNMLEQDLADHVAAFLEESRTGELDRLGLTD